MFGRGERERGIAWWAEKEREKEPKIHPLWSAAAADRGGGKRTKQLFRPSQEKREGRKNAFCYGGCLPPSLPLSYSLILSLSHSMTHPKVSLGTHHNLQVLA